MSNRDTLASASKTLMLKEPFYGLLLMSLNKIWSERVPTAGVGIHGIQHQLMINPEFWESLEKMWKVGILKHELLHIAFFHVTGDYGRERFPHREILNIAMDLEINQYIPRDWLPEDGCFVENFKELELERQKGTRYYYAKLMEDQENGTCQSVALQCILDAIANGEDECTLPDGTKIKIPKHDFEEVTEGMSEAAKKIVEHQTGVIVQQVAEQIEKSRGTVPGEIQGIIDKLRTIRPPVFDWKMYMRKFAGRSIKTVTKKSRRKYNVRMPGNPGIKITKTKRILAAIDTSGSVNDGELKEFLNELWHMDKLGHEVIIIQCDTKIQSIERFDRKKDWKIHGRGGTSFQPVVDYFNAHEKQFSCLIYFTDGYAPVPDNGRPSMLWVISSNGAKTEGLPGITIQIPEPINE